MIPTGVDFSRHIIENVLTMKQHQSNQWFHASEFARACKAIHQAATQEHTRWLGHPNVKYIQIRIDQRTGDFILQDQDGKYLEAEVIYSIFPELKD